MYFMYVDESGDPGQWDATKPAAQQGTSYFILTGFILPASEWRNYLSAMVEIRRQIKLKYGVPVRAELRGSTLINPRGDTRLKQLPRRRRVALYREVLEAVAVRMPAARVLNIYIDKLQPRYPSTSSADLQVRSWTFLIQRFDTFLKRQEGVSMGLIFADETNEVKIRRVLRRMRVYNPVPSMYQGYYHNPVLRVVEDPVIRKSQHSYFIQVADLIAHALYRKEHRKGSYRQFNIDRLFEVIRPLLLREASRSDMDGIVRL
ncbi:MAG: hypothetical protein KatS3mg023_3573 [Armatimonadota bacterium]|nr:MAG: hypothetical protein KatS3mg023_3573 [Armatimonadota bacterium]